MDIAEAYNQYEALIRPYRNLPDKESDDRIIARWRNLDASQQMRDVILYIGAAFPSHGGHPRCFAETAAAKNGLAKRLLLRAEIFDSDQAGYV